MNKVTKDTNVQQYEKLIQKLNVPEDRKAATPLNARWFIRTGYVQNRNNPLVEQVLDLARKIA
jgi:hypothetical protein